MRQPCFSYFNINTIDIWDFEYGWILDKPIEFDKFPLTRVMEELSEKMRAIAISKSTPFITYEHYLNGDDDLRRYYENKINRFHRVAPDFIEHICLEYFYCQNDGYQYRVNYEIPPSAEDFGYWFSLKIRQYELGLGYLFDFLNHHLSCSFEDNKAVYIDFLRIRVIRQYKNIFFSDRVSDTVMDYLNNLIPPLENQIVKKEPEIQTTKAIGKRPKTRKEYNSYFLTALKKDPAYLNTNTNEFDTAFEQLIEHKFIKADIDFDLDNFKKIFSGRGVSKTKRCVWIGGKIYLKLFVHYMIKTNKIEPMGNENWTTTIKCFLDKDGNEFDASQLQYANGGTTEKKKILYSIVDRL
ncbi:hypothetical protein ACSTS3_21445 [Aquimarina muelleri]|uniref:hypothetical protein n=1 Tax=Aquimarina muelleri TaxID=279356 RepID=UPI003F6858B8